MATFVLVHGSWAGGWYWWKVAPLLGEAGHTVYAPTLTGLAECRHLLTRDTGLYTHVADVAGLLTDADLHDVVLVGHSYGGMVITGAAELAPDRIRRLVYIDALYPTDGQSVFDLRPDARGGWQRMAATGDGWTIPPGTMMSSSVQEEDHAFVNARTTPMPVLAAEQPLQAPLHQAEGLPRGFVVCTAGHDQARLTAVRPANTATVDYHEVAASHHVIITHPRAIVDILLALVDVPASIT